MAATEGSHPHRSGDLPVQQTHEFIAAGEIRTIHIGRLCKIPVAAIDEFLAARESGPPPPNA